MAALALPMIVSNISVPLVGLVDTAIVGHFPGSFNLAGVSLGGVVITQIIWICGFLRMSATGFSAQAAGAKDATRASQILIDGLILAGIISLIVLLIKPFIFDFAINISEPSEETTGVASDYFAIRIHFIAVPLANLAVIGWMIGQHLHRQVMVIQVIVNLCNIALSLYFAVTLELGVKGVATATVISESLALCFSLVIIRQRHSGLLKRYSWDVSHIKLLLSANQDMFLRNIILQLCLATITFSGIRMGELTAATNAVLMQYFVLIALGLDGIAYAAEALTGKAVGAKDKPALLRWFRVASCWSLLIAGCYSLIFWLGFASIGSLITDLPDVRENIVLFKWYIVLLPLIGHWCFLMDGVYIGLMHARAMRNTMLLSTLLVFIPAWWLLSGWHNHGLWMSFLLFLAARGVFLGVHFNCLNKKGLLLSHK